MLKKDITGNKLSYKIIGVAMDVHNMLGAGYNEEVYQRAMEVALEKEGFCFEAQKQIEIFMGEELIAKYFLDLFVEDQVVIELKALKNLLTNDELAQVLRYLKETGSELGLLFNFGRKTLEYKRIFPPKKYKKEKVCGRYGVKIDEEIIKEKVLMEGDGDSVIR